MAVKEIKTRFKLEGEQQFKRTMTESAAAVKVLNSEEKLAEAQFKATGDAESYAAEKSRILKEQIKQQQVAVKAAEDAVKQLTKQGVQPNSKEMQTWQTKLNTARTKLVNMQTQLDKTETELKEQKTAVKGAADETGNYNTAMEKVAQGVDLQNTITAIDNLKGHIESIVKKAAQAAKAIWEMGVDSGKWADDLITQASQLNVSLEDLQGWQYAAKFIDTEVGTIGSAMAKLVNPTQAVTEQLQQLGVAMTKDGQARSRNDLFWDTVDAISALGDAEKQESAAQAIFGKKFADLNPLIKAGREAWDGYIQEAKDAGYILSDDKVLALGGVDDTIQKMNQSLDSLKNTVMAELAPAFQAVGDTITGNTDKLIEWANTEEGQTALQNLGQAITDVMSAPTNDITFEQLVNDAAGAVKALGEGFKWISDNKDMVAGAIKGVGAAYAALTVSKEVLLFMQLLKSTPLSKLTSFFGGGAAGSAAAGAAGGGGFISSLFGTAKTALGSAVAPLTVLTAAVAPAVIANQQDRDAARAQQMTTIERAEAAAEGLGEEADAFVQMISHAATALGVGNNDSLIGGDILADPAKVSEALKEAYRLNFSDVLDQDTQDMLSRFWDSLTNPAVEGLDAQQENSLLRSITQQLMDSLESMKSSGEDLGEYAGDGLVEGMSAKEEEVKTAGQNLADAGTQGITEAWDEHSPSRVMAALGENAAIGLANGINSRAGIAVAAAQALANRVTAIIQSALQIHSPSAVMEELGMYTGEGFAIGLARTAGDVDRAAGRMLSAVRTPLRYAPESAISAGMTYRSSGAQGGSQGAPGASTAHVTLMLDKEVLADTMVPLVDQKFGAKIQATRR